MKSKLILPISVGFNILFLTLATIVLSLGYWGSSERWAEYEAERARLKPKFDFLEAKALEVCEKYKLNNENCQRVYSLVSDLDRYGESAPLEAMREILGKEFQDEFRADSKKISLKE